MRNRVLVVDDEPEVRAFIEGMLKPSGFWPVCVGNGKEALDIIEKDPPDAVILDIKMPGIDGFNICSRIRKNSKTENMPVLIVTALGADDILDQCKIYDVDDYILKPFKKEELISKLQNIMQK